MQNVQNCEILKSPTSCVRHMTTSSRDFHLPRRTSIPLTGAGAVVIRIDEPETECIACGADCPKTQGLPMFEGRFLEANDPGEWAGFDACRPCFDAYTAGGIQGLMQHLSELRDNARASSLVRTYEELGGRRVDRSGHPGDPEPVADQALLDHVFTMVYPDGRPMRLTGRALLTSIIQQDWLAETRVSGG